jgi:hypothetical protein
VIFHFTSVLITEAKLAGYPPDNAPVYNPERIAPNNEQAARHRTTCSFSILATVNFRDGAKLRVGTKNEIHTRACPLHLIGLAVTPFENGLVFRNGFPLGAQVQDIHKEVVGD